MKFPLSPADRLAGLDVDRERLLMLGWRDAALTLSEEYEKRYAAEGDAAIETRRSRFLAMPVLYLFRHFFELRLKLLLRSLEKHGLAPLDPDAALGHRLRPLWDPLVSHYVRVVPPKKVELAAAENLFQQIDAADPAAQAFRYESDTKGRLHFEIFGAINMTTTVRSSLVAMNVIDEMAADLGLEERAPDLPPMPAESDTDTDTDTR